MVILIQFLEDEVAVAARIYEHSQRASVKQLQRNLLRRKLTVPFILATFASRAL